MLCSLCASLRYYSVCEVQMLIVHKNVVTGTVPVSKHARFLVIAKPYVGKCYESPLCTPLYLVYLIPS